MNSLVEMKLFVLFMTLTSSSREAKDFLPGVKLQGFVFLSGVTNISLCYGDRAIK